MLEVVVGNANSGPHRRLMPEDRKRVIMLVADGAAMETIAKEVSWSVRTVYLVRAQAGGVARRLEWDPSPTRLSAGEREEIRCGIDSGQSSRSIARQLGRSPSTVTREIISNG